MDDGRSLRRLTLEMRAAAGLLTEAELATTWLVVGEGLVVGPLYTAEQWARRFDGVRSAISGSQDVPES